MTFIHRVQEYYFSSFRKQIRINITYILNNYIIPNINDSFENNNFSYLTFIFILLLITSRNIVNA